MKLNVDLNLTTNGDSKTDFVKLNLYLISGRWRDTERRMLST